MGGNYLDEDDDGAIEKAQRIANAASAEWLGFFSSLQTPPAGSNYLDGPVGEDAEHAQAPHEPNPDAEMIKQDTGLILAAAVFGAIPAIAVLALLEHFIGDWVWVVAAALFWLVILAVILLPVFHRIGDPAPLDLGEHGVLRGKRKRRVLLWYAATVAMGLLLWEVGLPYLRAHLGEAVEIVFGGGWS